MRTEDQSRISWTALTLVVPPVCVFILSDLLLAALSWDTAAVVPDITSAAQSRFDAAGRLYILAAFLSVCVATYLTVLLFLNDLAHEFGARMRRKLLATLMAGLVVGAAWIITWNGQSPVDSLGSDYLRSATVQFERLANCPESSLAERIVRCPTAAPASANSELLTALERLIYWAERLPKLLTRIRMR